MASTDGDPAPRHPVRVGDSIDKDEPAKGAAMFLSEAEIAKITQVGPGTPMGELLRRYWHPIAGLHQVTEENPTAHVRMLGEDLVLFRDRSGRVGLLADHCSHRGVSLLYGRVEERGIACAYHGWLYDTAGKCPPGPPGPPGAPVLPPPQQHPPPVRQLGGGGGGGPGGAPPPRGPPA